MPSAPDFADILHQTQGEVRLYIAACGVPLADVDDIAQEVYLDFYQAQDKRPADVEPIRWLKGMARNHCLRWFAKRSRARNFMTELDQALESVTTTLEDAGGSDELLLALRACVQKLPAPSRSLLERYYGDEAIEDRGTSGVRMAVLRLREALRTCVRKQLGTA